MFKIIALKIGKKECLCVQLSAASPRTVGHERASKLRAGKLVPTTLAAARRPRRESSVHVRRLLSEGVNRIDLGFVLPAKTLRSGTELPRPLELGRAPTSPTSLWSLAAATSWFESLV